MQQVIKYFNKFKGIQPTLLKSLLLSFLVGVVLFSCGVELQLYEWENMDLRLLDRSNRDTLNAESNINAENFSILVSLNPENSITVRSSDWVNASEGFQANDAITNIEITSNKDYNDEFASGTLLNDVFRAVNIEEEGEGKTLDKFIDEFGKQSNAIREGFELVPSLGNDGNPRDSLRTFTIRLTLREAGTFIQTTAPIKLTTN